MNVKWKILIFFNILMAGISGILYGMGQISIKTEEVYFNSSFPDAWEQIDTNITLHGKFFYPPGFQESNQYPIFIMFHGVTRTLNDHDHFAHILAQHGILCFAIDFRGHGESTGTFPVNDGSRYNETFGDVMGTYRYLQNQTFFNASKAVVFGISLGGGSALYLALSGLVPKFVVWYPATAYVWGNMPLYQYNATSPEFEGLAMLGTEDECTRCNPDNMVQFASRHEGVHIYWLEGASHTDGRYYTETVDVTLQYLLNHWDLPSIPKWLKAVQNGSVSIAVLVGMGLCDLGILITYFLKKRTHSRALISK